MTTGHARDLRALEDAVREARARLAEARSQNARPGVPLALTEQATLLNALEFYASELARRGRPIPYRLQDELILYRTVLSPHDRSR